MPRRSSVPSIVEVSWSSIQIRPLVGSIIRLIILSDVVLPHPDGPTSTVIWPVAASNVNSSTALVPSGNCFETASNRIMPTNLTETTHRLSENVEPNFSTAEPLWDRALVLCGTEVRLDI